MTTAKKLNTHFQNLMKHLPKLPKGVSWLLPLQEFPESVQLTEQFLEKYYNDDSTRTLIVGINPGRHGAGITNVAFTDPFHLETECGIDSSFPKRKELSAIFVYQIINAYGGPELFYQKYFINSVVPFGFVKDGINYNYYDDKKLQTVMEPFIKFHFEELLKLGINKEVCYCLGTGKNFKYLNKLNEKEKYFDRVVPLEHPRYIMQYKRKKLEEYVDKYLGALG